MLTQPLPKKNDPELNKSDFNEISLADMIIQHYMQPKQYINQNHVPDIPFQIDQLNIICDQAIAVLQKQPMTLKLRYFC